MSPPVLIVSEQLNYTKPDGIHAIFMPVIIEFSRCISTYSSAKFELFILIGCILIPENCLKKKNNNLNLQSYNIEISNCVIHKAKP